MENDKIYEWKLAFLPSLNNSFNKKVRKMNLYGNLPFPFSFLADIYREKLMNNFLKITNVRFNYDFYCAFGNLYGEEVWFTNTYILDYAPVYFGKHITIGPDVKLITSWHEPENFNIVKAKSIIIEDNVWITMNAIVLPGVKIGKNSIIGAGAIVTKSMPPNSLIAGNPAKVVKKIDRSYPYWNELKKDVTKKYIEKKRNNFLLKVLMFPFKLFKKIVKEFIKKII